MKPFQSTALASATFDLLRLDLPLALTRAERLLSRLTDPRMHAVVVNWHRDKQDGKLFLPPGRLNLAKYGLVDHAFLVAIDWAKPPLLQYHFVGRALTQELARNSHGGASSESLEAEGSTILNMLDAVYRR